VTAAAPSKTPVAAKYLAMRAPRSRSDWASEISMLCARYLFELPLTPSLALRVPGVDGVVRIGAGTPGAAMGFDGDEWRALVTATEADRVWPGDFVDLCRRKGGEPTYRVGLVDALAGGQPDPAERWGVSRVLSRWGVELLAVDLTS